MRRGFVCVLLTIWLLTGLAQPAVAAVQTGSITVSWGTDSGSVTLYRVGTPISGGFMLRQEFGGGIISDWDVSSHALAQWLYEQAEYEGWTIQANELGEAEFPRLEQGLYLLVQERAPEGYYPFLPFLVALPYEGQWHLRAEPKMEKYPGEQPRTGEDGSIYAAAVTMAVSGMGIVFCMFRKRKKR